MPSLRTSRLLGAAPIIVGLGILAYGVWHNTAKRRAVLAKPAVAYQDYPDYAPALIAANREALGAFSTPQAQAEITAGTLAFTSEQAAPIKDRAKLALSKAPMEVRAITQMATADYLQVLNWTDRDTLMLAKSRNARDRQTLLALTMIDARAGNFSDLLDTLDLRHRLGNTNAQDMALIKGLSAIPQIRPLVDSKLKETPAWGFEYFRYAIPGWTSSDIQANRASLFVFLNNQDDPFVRTTLLRLYFIKLYRIAEFETALEDWSALPELGTLRAKPRGVFNTAFKDLPPPPPFNWRTFERDLALSEIEVTGGLYASSSSPKRVLIARQITNALTGRALRLEVDGTWRYREQQGNFLWRLSCLPARTPYYDLKLGDAGRETGSLSVEIAPLPEGCKFQELQFYAQPGGFNERISARVTRAEIVDSNAAYPAESDTP